MHLETHRDDEQLVIPEQNLKNIPLEDRPREKMARLGASSLSDAELMAVLLRTGTKEQSALSIGQDLTKNGKLYRELAGITELNELTQFKGLGKAKAATVLAALEIGRRIASAKALEKIKLNSPKVCAQYLMARLRYAKKEMFYVLLLDGKNMLLDQKIISEGILNQVPVHPREVFAPAILGHASKIIVAHNHPSGDPRPSKEDTALTEKLYLSGKTLGIDLVDHIIIGDGIYYSYQEQDFFCS
ncbi:MAG: DNA repair protein RadC [Phascolarctobacterium sp.]|nr:DNA repair protein RadC [Phascolarctobacterium sp.]